MSSSSRTPSFASGPAPAFHPGVARRKSPSAAATAKREAREKEKRRNCGAATNPELANSRQHVCELCQSRFLCKSKLDRHMLTHTGDKPFECYCGKSFNQKSALKNHSRRHIKKRDLPQGIDVVRDGLNGFTYQGLMDKMK